jgi:EAL domain-containing protein (putative c-di-GMP-specific phosphodiesterase class I)
MAGLVAHGCDQLQGYYLGRPMPMERLHGWLEDYPMSAIGAEATGSRL